VEQLEPQLLLTDTLIDILHHQLITGTPHPGEAILTGTHNPAETIITGTKHAGETIRMATIVRLVKGRKVAVDQIRSSHTLLYDMEKPRISGVFFVWGCPSLAGIGPTGCFQGENWLYFRERPKADA
jgi:hypothetical protein